MIEPSIDLGTRPLHVADEQQQTPPRSASPPHDIATTGQLTPGPERLKRKRSRKRPLIFIGAVAAAALIISQCTGAAAVTALPEVTTASLEDLALTSSANGTIEAARTVPLSLRANGTVTELTATVGQNVRAGDVLARIDDAPGLRDIELRRTAVDEANARLQGARAGTAATPLDRAAGTATVRHSQVQSEASRAAAAEATRVATDSATLNNQLVEQATEQARSDRLQLAVENSRLDEQIEKRATGLAKRDAAQAVLDAAKQKATAATNTRDGLRDELTRQRQRIAELQTVRDDTQRAYSQAVADDDRARQVAQAAADPLVPFSWAKSTAVTRAEGSLAAAEKAVSSAEAVTIGQQANIEKASELAVRSDTEQAVAQGRLDTAVASLEATQQAVDAANRVREQSAITAERSAKAAQVAQRSADLTAARDRQNIQATRQATAQAEAATAAARAANRAKEQGGRPADIIAAETAVRSARISLRQAEDRLGDYRIVAPFDGVVTATGAKLGEQVTSATTVVTLMTTSGFRVRVGFPEVDAARIRSGNTATVTFDALPDEQTTATVESVEPTAASVNGVSTYSARVLLDSIPETVRVGMTANVRVLTETRSKVLVVPLGAVGQNELGESVVKVVVETSEAGMKVRGTRAVPSTQAATRAVNQDKKTTPVKRSKGLDASGAEQTRSVQTVIVELGDTADGKAEIVNGLSEGDVVEIAAQVTR